MFASIAVHTHLIHLGGALPAQVLIGGKGLLQIRNIAQTLARTAAFSRAIDAPCPELGEMAIRRLPLVPSWKVTPHALARHFNVLKPLAACDLDPLALGPLPDDPDQGSTLQKDTLESTSCYGSLPQSLVLSGQDHRMSHRRPFRQERVTESKLFEHSQAVAHQDQREASGCSLAS